MNRNGSVKWVFLPVGGLASNGVDWETVVSRNNPSGYGYKTRPFRVFFQESNWLNFKWVILSKQDERKRESENLKVLKDKLQWKNAFSFWELAKGI